MKYKKITILTHKPKSRKSFRVVTPIAYYNGLISEIFNKYQTSFGISTTNRDKFQQEIINAGKKYHKYANDYQQGERKKYKIVLV